MANPNPFSIFKVYPDWGAGSARIEWEVTSGVVGENIYLYRSPLGLPGTWERITPDPQTRAGTFVDTGVPRDDLHAFHYYRGLIADSDVEDTWLRGEAISALSTLTRREYHVIKTILRREWRDMVRGNGVAALHCIAKESGELASGVDPVMRVTSAAACPGDTNYGYGQLFAGGFHEPVATRVRFLQIAKQADTDTEDATGARQDREVSLRLMAFPRPRKGHMIVLPDSDRRYVLTDSIQPFWFKAEYPVAWECKAMLIEQRDARHKLPSPDQP